MNKYNGGEIPRHFLRGGLFMKIPLACKLFRISKGFTQKQIADDLGYSVENISAFECGRNNNYKILLWYVKHGFNMSNVGGALDVDNN